MLILRLNSVTNVRERETSIMDAFLARQPIFKTNMEIYAYEILYRSGSINKFDGVDGDQSSRQVIFNTFQTFGIKNLTKGKPVFINFTESLINDETATLFPKEFLVLEILEDVIPNKGIIESCKALKEMGYTIALDDFIFKPDYQKLIELADIIKVDFLESNTDDIQIITNFLRDTDKILLAEKVETREVFNYAKSLGFSLFQGYFFSKPEIVRSKTLQPVKTTYLQLLSESKKTEIEFAKIARIISRDLALSYNLFRLVNSPTFGFRYRVRSVQHAVVALGEKEIKKWISLVVVNSIGQDEPDELTRLSLIRARFLELIALNTNYRRHSEELFLIGLFSLLDVILKAPLYSILEELKAPDRVTDALIHGTGEFGDIFNMAILYEKGQWDEFLYSSKKLNIKQSMVANVYLESLVWCNKL